MQLQALILGDGIAADTGDARRRAFNTVFAEAGLDWNWGPAVYSQLLDVAGPAGMIAEFVRTRLSHWRDTPDTHKLFSTIERRQAAVYLDMAKGDMPVRPGIEAILVAASNAGLRIAAAGTDVPADPRIVKLPPQASLDAEHGDGRPSPGPHARVLAALGLASQDCLALENTTEGLTAARQQGIPAIFDAGGGKIVAFANLLSHNSVSLDLSQWHLKSPAEIIARLHSLHAEQILPGQPLARASRFLIA